MRELRLPSLWCPTAPMPPPKGIRMTIGIFACLATGNGSRDLADDLVVYRVDEPVELDLDHRSAAAQRERPTAVPTMPTRPVRVDDPARRPSPAGRTLGPPSPLRSPAEAPGGAIFTKPPKLPERVFGSQAVALGESRSSRSRCGRRCLSGRGPAAPAALGWLAEVVGHRRGREVVVGDAVAVQARLGRGRSFRFPAPEVVPGARRVVRRSARPSGRCRPRRSWWGPGRHGPAESAAW